MMDEYDQAIAWLKNAIRETDETLSGCSEKLKSELMEQRTIFTTALTALSTLKIARVETARLMEKLRSRSALTGVRQ
jgi:hypothetical protein